MKRTAYRMLGLALMLTLVLARGGNAQSHSPQHHPGGTLASPTSPTLAIPPDAKTNETDEEDETEPMEQIQGMREQMQGMRGHRSLMPQRHLAHLVQQLKLNDEQRAQVQALLYMHAKEVIRLQAELDIWKLDVRQLLATEPVDLARVKPLLQNIAAKEADLRLAHLTARQGIRALLTPEQQQQFRSIPGHMMGASGMQGHGGIRGAGGMAGQGGMMGMGQDNMMSCGMPSRSGMPGCCCSGTPGEGTRSRGGMMGCCCGGMMGCRLPPQ